MKVLSFVIIFTIVFFSCTSRKNIELNSPDKSIQLLFQLNNNKSPEYKVLVKNKLILDWSKLGLVLKNGGSLNENLKIQHYSIKTIDEKWDAIANMTDSVRNHYNEIKIELQETINQKRKLNIYFRIYNDGVAFRYELPGKVNDEKIELLSELTEFKFASDYSCWPQYLPHFNYFYEQKFCKTSISKIYKDSSSIEPIYGGGVPQFYHMQDLIGLPFTVNVDDSICLSITESNLKDNAGMYLTKVPEDSLTLKTVLAPLRVKEDVAVISNTPYLSAWRTIIIGKKHGDLIESRLVLNLAEPCAIKDPSWIKPGKCSWEWWTDKSMIVNGKKVFGKMNHETIKYYIDFSSEMGFEYMLIDWMWYGNTTWFLYEPRFNISKSIPEINIPELVEYAKTKNVGIFIWLHWKNVNDQMEEAFANYQKWGVKGVKIDFTNSDDQYMVNWYWEVAKAAAEHKLLLDIHGAMKPTGLNRTYPNFLTCEGVMGMEWTRWTENITPQHNVNLAFTRMLAGPMDYTPGAFDNVTKEQFNWKKNNYTAMGTRCHQLALFVIFESPLMVVCDYPGNINNGLGKDFLKQVPSSWDDVKVLDAKIGEYLVVARKKGKNWFIGGITNWNSKNINLNFQFLDNGKYRMQLYKDGLNVNINAKDALLEVKDISRKDRLDVIMSSGGGFAIYLEKM